MTIKNIIGLAFIIAILLPFLYPVSWTSNEYNYFGIAKHNIDPVLYSINYAAYNDQLARFLSDYTMGLPIKLFGYDKSWLILRIVGLLWISFALLFLVNAQDIAIFPTIIAIILFNKLKQTYFGGEWLFGGIEPKIFSYVFVFYGLGYATRNKLPAVAACLTIATYFHFLVGGFWGLAIFIYIYLNTKNKRTLYTLFYYSLSLMPLLGLLIYDNQKQPALIENELGHSIDQIYSNIRAPHHLAPFDGDQIRENWGQGFLLVPVNLLILFSIYRLKLGSSRSFLLWLILLHAYLVSAIIIAYFDRNTQHFGKFYLFRPSSFILLLTLLVYCDLIYKYVTRIKISSTAIYLVLSIVVFTFTAKRISLNNLIHIPTLYSTLNPDEKVLVNWLKSNTKASDIILYEEDDKGILAADSIEQLIDRPTLVNWKFVPTTKYSIGRWYQLILLKRQAFSGECPAFDLLPAKYYIAYTIKGSEGISQCAQTLFSVGKYHVAVH